MAYPIVAVLLCASASPKLLVAGSDLVQHLAYGQVNFQNTGREEELKLALWYEYRLQSEA